LLAKEGDYAVVRMPSGELRRIHIRCQATIGQVGNIEHENESGGKAGRGRWLGQRPEVRGSTMNPRDHPHGGGEGKTGPGGNPKTPWGKPALGYRTRKANKASAKLIIRRREKKGRKKEVSRSTKKGPFISAPLKEKIEKMNQTRDKKVIRTWAREPVTYSDMVGHTIAAN